MAKTGYVNGSDLLIKINSKPIGHCTSHTCTFSSETKDRAVKPVATLKIADGKWKEKGVNGLSISIKGEGLRVFDETEGGFKALLSIWSVGQSVDVEAFERIDAENGTTTPYLKGNFVITSLEESAPANEDATYSVQLENSGAPSELKASVLTGETITENNE